VKKRKIPTIIGIITLVFSLATAVIFVQYKQLFRLGAVGSSTPKDVRVSNISKDSFSISWLTDTATLGYVAYGETQNNFNQNQKEKVSTPGYTHLAKISNLKSQTTYYFKINSGGKDYDNNRIPWQGLTTNEVDTPLKSILVSGNVITASGNPSQNSLVYISFGGKLLSTLTSQNGTWVIPISAEIDGVDTLLEISVLAGLGEITSAQIYPQSAKPVPTMILGQTYDFKSLPPSQESDIPQATIGIPEESSPSSGFNIPENIASPSAKTVTLSNIEESETITNTKPEFLGKGPSGTKLQITVESDPVTGQAVISKSGDWNWEIPRDLSPGEHKITISWKDAAGITRTLTKNFIVQAAEGPAFVSTPSATPTQSATPTATPKLTATPTSTASAFPVPDSGSLTPTIFLSIMGIGLIAFSFLLWRKAEI